MRKVDQAYSTFVLKTLIVSTNGHSFHLTPTLCHQQGKTPTESIYGASPSALIVKVMA